MKKRVITGIFIVLAVIAAILLRQVSLIIFDIFIFAIMLVAAGELYVCFTQKEIYPLLIPLVVTFVGLVVGFYLWGFIGIVCALFVGFLSACINFLFVKNIQINALFSTLFIILYPLGLFSLVLLLNNSYGGFLGIILALLISMFTDTFAYFIGVLYGKRKLCPELSPHKTIAGFIGGILGGIIASLICFIVFQGAGWFANTVDVFIINVSLDYVIWIYLGLGILGALLNTFGDLFASQIKRKCEIKDFGNIFPGHGGIMDRIDGLMWVVPLIVLTFYIF